MIFQNAKLSSKHGEQIRIEVSSICGGCRLHRICVPAPVLQRRCPARPRFVRGRGAVSRFRRLMKFSRCGYQELQAGHPAANSLGKIKKAAPQGTKRFCRGQAAAKWFGAAAGQLFSILKWLVWVRGYHERGMGVNRKIGILYGLTKSRLWIYTNEIKKVY